MPAKPTTFLLYTYYKNLMTLQKWVRLGLFCKFFHFFCRKIWSVRKSPYICTPKTKAQVVELVDTLL
jgi:hypothetical protein